MDIFQHLSQYMLVLPLAKVLNLTKPKGFLLISVANLGSAKGRDIGGDNKTTINWLPITLGGDIIQKADNKDVRNIHELFKIY
jgi:hypothetical protein